MEIEQSQWRVGLRLAHFGCDEGRGCKKHTVTSTYLLFLAGTIPSLQLEARALTFGGTEGSMLGRRGWFDAFSKGMVQCQIEGKGLMLGQRG